MKKIAKLFIQFIEALEEEKAKAQQKLIVVPGRQEDPQDAVAVRNIGEEIGRRIFGNDKDDSREMRRALLGMRVWSDYTSMSLLQLEAKANAEKEDNEAEETEEDTEARD